MGKAHASNVTTDLAGACQKWIWNTFWAWDFGPSGPKPWFTDLAEFMLIGAFKIYNTNTYPNSVGNVALRYLYCCFLLVIA